MRKIFSYREIQLSMGRLTFFEWGDRLWWGMIPALVSPAQGGMKPVYWDLYGQPYITWNESELSLGSTNIQFCKGIHFLGISLISMKCLFVFKRRISSGQTQSSNWGCLKIWGHPHFWGCLHFGGHHHLWDGLHLFALCIASMQNFISLHDLEVA